MRHYFFDSILRWRLLFQFYLNATFILSLHGRFKTISYWIFRFSIWPSAGPYKTMPSSRCNTDKFPSVSVLISTTLLGPASTPRKLRKTKYSNEISHSMNLKFYKLITYHKIATNGEKLFAKQSIKERLHWIMRLNYESVKLKKRMKIYTHLMPFKFDVFLKIGMALCCLCASTEF